METKDRTELKRLKRELRQESFEKLKPIGKDLEETDMDLAVRIDDIRSELKTRLIPIGGNNEVV